MHPRRVLFSGGKVDPVTRAEVVRDAVGDDSHPSLDNDAYLVVRMSVLLVDGAAIIRPLGDVQAFRYELGDGRAPIEPSSQDACHADTISAMGNPRPPLEPLLAAPQKALKEWAVVCRALEQGRQSVLLRKGGIIEETRDFSLVERRFLLYPTYEHQELDSVQDAYKGWFRETLEAKPPDDVVRIGSWAEVTDLFLTHSLDALLALSEHYAWSHDYIRMRMAYKPRKPMNVVVVRTWLLPEPVDIPVLEHFAGCKSWVPLEQAVPLDGSTPAITEDELGSRLEAIGGVLGDAERVAV